ncbi:site-2 protease family protein [Lachnospira multipara]|uniref:site-2 protease family protein n=1 Tax=Lachnospira multipara TaxID=28051 RepID=UPI0004E1492B|nr:site-2 protease family protein [Lachnospira multipara]
MKKFCQYILVLVISILFGIGIGTFMTEFEIDKLFKHRIDYATIIGLFALAMLFSVTLHELSHAFYFWINKVPLRFVAIFLFGFYKDDKKWKFIFYPNKITLRGGIAIPDLPAVNNESQFKKIRKVYSRALLFAPIISFVEAIVAMVAYATLLFSELITKYTNASVFLVFCIFAGFTMFFHRF